MSYRRSQGTAARTARYNAKERRRAQKQMKGFMGFIGLCCSACLTLFVLVCKMLFWLCKWMMLFALWCGKQIATAAVYVALGVREWWQHRND